MSSTAMRQGNERPPGGGDRQKRMQTRMAGPRKEGYREQTPAASLRTRKGAVRRSRYGTAAQMDSAVRWREEHKTQGRSVAERVAAQQSPPRETSAASARKLPSRRPEGRAPGAPPSSKRTGAG